MGSECQRPHDDVEHYSFYSAHLGPRFESAGPTASVWITEVTEHEVHSSPEAFYNVARLVIEQAAGLLKLRSRESTSRHA